MSSSTPTGAPTEQPALVYDPPDGRLAGPVNTDLGLSDDDRYLVVPRTLAQSMPEGWQRRLVDCLTELNAAYRHLDLPGRWYVMPALLRRLSRLSKGDLLAIGIDTWQGDDGKPVYADAERETYDGDDLVLLPSGPDPVPYHGNGTYVPPRIPSPPPDTTNPERGDRAAMTSTSPASGRPADPTRDVVCVDRAVLLQIVDNINGALDHARRWGNYGQVTSAAQAAAAALSGVLEQQPRIAERLTPGEVDHLLRLACDLATGTVTEGDLSPTEQELLGRVGEVAAAADQAANAALVNDFSGCDEAAGSPAGGEEPGR